MKGWSHYLTFPTPPVFRTTGFIGCNGAGKTTTLKSILNLVHADSGQVSVLGKDFASNEFACKQKIGFMFGGIDYYPKEKLKNITSVVKRFGLAAGIAIYILSMLLAYRKSARNFEKVDL